MKLQFRRRSLLLPATSLLGCINNLSRASFTADERKRLIIAGLIEYLGVGFGITGLDQIINVPYHEGRFSRELMNILGSKHVNSYGIERELKDLHQKVFAELREQIIKYGMLTGEVVARRTKNEPGIFDHGYTVKVVTPKGKAGRNKGTWLLVEWVRPTLDMEEMSVNTFFRRIAKQLATRKQPVEYWLAVFHSTRLEAFLQVENLEILHTVLRTAGRK
ncbi:hypothetical protein ASESINO_103 [Erwinia phage vB_EamM_Asesino]|uniref:Uncharacterized protein n=1 Tax=Erwinia phage vB_EamM_Asesino TaxID=1883370 RepID=A0A1B2IA53_9CAUD|nr:hypothetical protein ASESINO_103 [Erwinia phage vB_EamM_Asesino]ANZ48116.1 hypothetical protein ASESINO_103 [Erwinia phage vB_EamM_Asesino]